MTRDEIIRKVTETLGCFETDYRDPDKVLEHCHEDLDWWVPGDTRMSGRREGRLAARLSPTSAMRLAAPLTPPPPPARRARSGTRPNRRRSC